MQFQRLLEARILELQIKKKKLHELNKISWPIKFLCFETFQIYFLPSVVVLVTNAVIKPYTTPISKPPRAIVKKEHSPKSTCKSAYF